VSKPARLPGDRVKVHTRGARRQYRRIEKFLSNQWHRPDFGTIDGLAC
jgi:hypothetical protein